MFMPRDQGDIYFSGSFPTLSEPLASLSGGCCPCWLCIQVVRAQLVGLIHGLRGKLLASEHLQLKKPRNALRFPSNLTPPELSIPSAHCAPLCWNAFRTQPGREPAGGTQSAMAVFPCEMTT